MLFIFLKDVGLNGAKGGIISELIFFKDIDFSPQVFQGVYL